MIGSCLLQYGYSCKLENNCCSVCMNKTFYGHTPNENGLLDLDRGDTHFHNIEAKKCRVNNDSATYLWHYRLGHIGATRPRPGGRQGGGHLGAQDGVTPEIFAGEDCFCQDSLY